MERPSGLRGNRAPPFREFRTGVNSDENVALRFDSPGLFRRG